MKRLLILLFIISSLLTAQNIDTLDYKICINAGHGGHDSNDRPPVTPAGFWESEGNLTKALALETILKEYGVADIDDSTRAHFRTVMTRRNNRTQDDLALSSIAAMANSNNCDWMQSIHSNAFNGTAYYTLILYPGPDGDPRINGLPGYPSCPEEETFSVKVGTNIRDALRTGALYTRGDWSFYRDRGTLSRRFPYPAGAGHTERRHLSRLLSGEPSASRTWISASTNPGPSPSPSWTSTDCPNRSS
ncbi:MAG: N-acetylmuramoyl-L-alanine amidase [Candidatus Marinimicrobia bacterium]|nr:N-acetylmuramoyl-L-alanine amidase [Candidatus Neomarinimicrobiota bacterium]